MSLYENINRRKRNKTSRTKAKSTISDKAYANMKVVGLMQTKLDLEKADQKK